MDSGVEVEMKAGLRPTDHPLFREAAALFGSPAVGPGEADKADG